MSGICDTCKLKPRCISPAEGVMECTLYEQNRKDRWFQLFGTPERAARTLQPDSMRCEYCLLRGYCRDGICLIDDYDSLIEWLRGDA